ncbi:MAG: glutamate-1-semialdehyde 2,1-aminomutase [Proteobacteria bacterium]|nr:glutamate-1-semialdehyde 2,1-aminomutase [Pseudomonadota bacterium]
MSQRQLRFEKSRRLRERAHAIIPGGAHTYAKGDDQFPELSPGFIVRGKGCHVWDADGNEFIEYGMGLRAVTLGHAFPAVIEAASRDLANGCNFTRPSPIEIDCAEALLATVPAAEMVKFCKDGSGATSAAVKIARAYTGRDKVAICAEHPFFSTYDWFIGSTPMSAGIPRAVQELTLKFHYADLASLETLFAANRGEIACIVMEAARIEEPPEGYLAAVRALCHANGALFIIDEMITGFRWHEAHAQGRYGIEPDLSCFGKAMANGFSVSALVGKREFMRLGGLDHHDKPRVFLLSTTHGAETHGLAAAIATMRVYRDEPVIETLHRQGTRLATGVNQAMIRHGLSDYVRVFGNPSCLFFGALDRARQPSQAFRTLLMQELIANGVLSPSLVVSYSHSDDDIDRTIDAFDRAAPTYLKALDAGPERFLVGRPTELVYRAFNSKPSA